MQQKKRSLVAPPEVTTTPLDATTIIPPQATDTIKKAKALLRRGRKTTTPHWVCYCEDHRCRINKHHQCTCERDNGWY